jgi:hypothetical protein
MQRTEGAERGVNQGCLLQTLGFVSMHKLASSLQSVLNAATRMSLNILCPHSKSTVVFLVSTPAFVIPTQSLPPFHQEPRYPGPLLWVPCFRWLCSGLFQCPPSVRVPPSRLWPSRSQSEYLEPLNFYPCGPIFKSCTGCSLGPCGPGDCIIYSRPCIEQERK